jgi:hypothetical protein
MILSLAYSRLGDAAVAARSTMNDVLMYSFDQDAAGSSARMEFSERTRKHCASS